MGTVTKVNGLTERQREVVALVRRGLSNGEIAHELGISDDGVKAHLSRLYLRFDVTNRVALLAALDDANLPIPTLGELRAIVGSTRERSRRLGVAALPASVSDRLAAAREALASVDVALDLVRDLPPDTSGAVLDALRRRVAAAVAAIDDVNPTTSVTGSARTV